MGASGVRYLGYVHGEVSRDQGMPGAERKSQGWDRVRGFIMGMGEMILG